MSKISRITTAFILLTAWIILLSIPLGKLPPLGKFLSPGSGFWANAQAVKNPKMDFKPMKPDSILRKTVIIFDNRLVPHIKATNDYNLYYTQGYIQAYYRLWQMDMQTRAAAGRISEIAGKAALKFDRGQRRKGMIWAAKHSLKAMESNPKTKTMLTAYTAGVNAYIHSLDYKQLPLEYKLMNFKPESWKPLKCALLLKYMADMLAGYSRDIAMSYVRQYFPKNELNLLFPDKMKRSDPVIPRGTAFSKPTLQIPRKLNDSLLFVQMPKNNKPGNLSRSLAKRGAASGIGSNNWAVNGHKTQSGYSILCNDPHLNLNLPSIWFETQLTAPGINCYGVSIPGAPGIIIGFNNNISWGLTNNYRDVKDYYALKTDASENHYLFNGKQKAFRKTVEKIFIKGQRKPFLDTVRYAIQGPVEYDKNFPDPSQSGYTLAMCWMGHRATNELLALYLLNRAKNYPTFISAIQHFECPAQNFIYADTKGNIALWGQGQFIDKWRQQGSYIMRGDTSATLWGKAIPMDENPHILNPSQNYLESANQQVTDNSYPYYYQGDFTEFRSWEISRFLNQNKKFSVSDMMALQNNNWSIIAQKLMPVFYQYGQDFGKKFPNYFRSWNDSLMPDSRTGAAFQIWWHYLYQNLWKKKFGKLPIPVFPSKEETIALILKDTNALSQLIQSNFPDVVQRSFRETADSLRILKKEHKTLWYQIKHTSVLHLAKIQAFSYTGLPTGGSGTTINAMRRQHGPSWRMIVLMKPDDVSAWCAYPGGQSGNPGSPYYNSFLNYWVKGKYYKIQFFQAKDYTLKKSD